MARYDAIVIGGGVNGLTSAAYLAKAGVKTLVLEQRREVGGGAVTAEIAPGVRVPALAHTAGPLRRDVVEELALGSHGLEFLANPVDVVALGGPRPLVVWADPARTADGLRVQSPRDAEAWPRFTRSLAALGRVIGSLFTAAPPDVDAVSGRDLWTLLRTFRRFRALDRQDAYRLLRWAPMPVADLVGECFETEPLRACLAGEAVLGTALGPWSAGSGLVLLLKAANEQTGTGGRDVKGGPGAIAAALATAARSAGADIRVGAGVSRILVKDERARGVALADGTEVEGRAVVSAVDPRQTFLQLCDPIDLAPEFLWRMRHYRAQGMLAKLNLALSSLPEIPGVPREAMTGRIRVCPNVDYIERAFDHAKYGRYSPEPYIEFTIPTLLDPTLASNGAHVLSAYVQFAPYALRQPYWDLARDPLAEAALDTLERHVPGVRRLVTARQIITPLDLERTYGITGGHIFHGELALDQLVSMRPLLRSGRYRAPIAGLYLCSSGTHPGTGLTGGSGANAAREILRDLRSRQKS